MTAENFIFIKYQGIPVITYQKIVAKFENNLKIMIYENLLKNEYL